MLHSKLNLNLCVLLTERGFCGIMTYHMVKSTMLHRIEKISKTRNGATFEMSWSCVGDIEVKANRAANWSRCNWRARINGNGLIELMPHGNKGIFF